MTIPVLPSITAAQGPAFGRWKPSDWFDPSSKSVFVAPGRSAQTCVVADRGMRGGVAWVGLQLRAVDDKLLAETADQPVRQDRRPRRGQLSRWLTPART